MEYLIQINEEQRVALLEILKAAPLSMTGVQDAPLEFWVEMLDALPSSEAEDSGIVHAFCL
jgi:hypothetical protein